MKILNFTKISVNSFLKNNASLVFIAINVLVAFLGFVRSFAFMNFFNFKQLGIITLVSTGAMLIGFFQLGLINGGYRIIALREAESNIKTNNVIFSYFSVLSLFLLIISILGFILGFFTDWLILAIFNIMGVCMLITNWLTNTLIGGSEFKRLNIANGVSAIASLLCLLLAYYFGIYGALLSLLIQPFLFIVIVFLTDNKEIPTNFDFDIAYIKYILGFGFVPFLSGIFFMVYMQIERWSINAFLGPEALGKMYLIFLTTTLWVLVPSSILNLFFPKAIKHYSEKDWLSFKKVIRLNSLITLGYCISVSIIIVVLLDPMVGLVFPKHQPYVYLVIVGLPGLIFRTLSDPISLYLNSVVKLKPIFWSDILALIVYVSCISFLFLIDSFSLNYFVICFDIYFSFKFFYLLFVYLKIRI